MEDYIKIEADASFISRVINAMKEKKVETISEFIRSCVNECINSDKPSNGIKVVILRVKGLVDVFDKVRSDVSIKNLLISRVEVPIPQDKLVLLVFDGNCDTISLITSLLTLIKDICIDIRVISI